MRWLEEWVAQERRRPRGRRHYHPPLVRIGYHQGWARGRDSDHRAAQTIPAPGTAVDALISRAQCVPGKGARLKLMEVSACHDNAAKLAIEHRGWRWFYGMALSDDGCWRVHSWAVTTRGRIVETTEPRKV